MLFWYFFWSAMDCPTVKPVCRVNTSIWEGWGGTNIHGDTEGEREKIQIIFYKVHNKQLLFIFSESWRNRRERERLYRQTGSSWSPTFAAGMKVSSASSYQWLKLHKSSSTQKLDICSILFIIILTCRLVK